MLPNQLLTPELGAESMDTTSTATAVAPAAMSLQNICVEIAWVTVEELQRDKVMSLYSSVSEFLNHAPFDVCTYIIKWAEIIVADVQNVSAIENALYVHLIPYIVLYINLC